MHPNITVALATDRVAELRREAQHAQLVAEATSVHRPTTWRRAVGTVLVGAGHRLAGDAHHVPLPA